MKVSFLFRYKANKGGCIAHSADLKMLHQRLSSSLEKRTKSRENVHEKNCNCQRAASRGREAARRQPNRAVCDCSRGRKNLESITQSNVKKTHEENTRELIENRESNLYTYLTVPKLSDIGNLKIYNRNEGKALAIPPAEFRNNNCSA